MQNHLARAALTTIVYNSFQALVEAGDVAWQKLDQLLEKASPVTGGILKVASELVVEGWAGEKGAGSYARLYGVHGL